MLKVIFIFLISINLDPLANTRPPSTGILESPGDEMDMQEVEHVARNETNESFFRFIPSAHFQKRPRTPTSEVTSLSKVSLAPLVFLESSYLLHLIQGSMSLSSSVRAKSVQRGVHQQRTIDHSVCNQSYLYARISSLHSWF